VLDAAERGMERFYAGDHDRTLPDLPATRGWQPSDGDILRKNDYASLRVRELAALVRHPSVGATAAALSAAAGIRLWHDQLLYKPVDRPGISARVGWHTDRQYWQSCSSEDMLTAWVGFHDVDDNRWRPGPTHPNDTLVRADPSTNKPDYTDPAIQPLLWPATLS
jgi:hypothetical protein